MQELKVKANELRLADTIRIPSAGIKWNCAIVRQIKETSIELFRPYGTTADFSYTGGVICYIGIECYEIPRDNCEFVVIERKVLK